MNKQKKIVAILMAILIVITLAGFSPSFAWIGDRYDTEDEAFFTVMTEMREEHNYDYNTYTYEKAATYNTAGEINGYVYEFLLDSVRPGFVLMAKLENEIEVFYEVTEIFVDSYSAFKDNAGLNIYPSFCRYLSHEDGIYTDLTTREIVDAEAVKAIEESGFGFQGETSHYGWSERIDYSTRTISTVQTTAGFPGWTGGSTLGSNDCAVIAGKNIMVYWTYYKPSLIPDLNPITLIYNGVYYWKGESNQYTYVANELYTRMGTNTTGAGTTVAQFKTGMTSCAAAYGGYSTTFRSTMTSGSYDINKMLTEFSSQRPVALFMTPYYNFLTINAYSGYDYINQTDVVGSHVMVAYGRQIFTYNNSIGSQIRQIHFLMVAGCADGASIGWIRLNEGSLTINDSCSVEII